MKDKRDVLILTEVQQNSLGNPLLSVRFFHEPSYIPLSVLWIFARAVAAAGNTSTFGMWCLLDSSPLWLSTQCFVSLKHTYGSTSVCCSPNNKGAAELLLCNNERSIAREIRAHLLAWSRWALAALKFIQTVGQGFADKECVWDGSWCVTGRETRDTYCFVEGGKGLIEHRWIKRIVKTVLHII